ncbi:hypothetical protein LTS08_004855 [Lithohypha guttulata]|nr:hypothetical protein LTS08_004855 [Lithohypha guttulata]
MKSLFPLGLASIILARPGPTRRTRDEPCACHIFTLCVDISDVSTAVFPFAPLEDQYQATNLLTTITNRVQTDTAPRLKNLTATYEVQAHLCAPKRKKPFTTLQILTHGIGFNSSYWNFYPSRDQSDLQYNYINAATIAGHTTLSYNRLGISGSTLADPYTEVQFPVELAILIQITTLAKAGKIPYLKQAPTKIVHVGHSFGFTLANAMVASHPSLSDGIIPIAYNIPSDGTNLSAANTNFMIANLADSIKFPAIQCTIGYLTWPSKWAKQDSFFAYGAFEPAVLDDAENTKQPFSVGEFASFGLLGDLNASNFKGPVLYVEGEEDLIACASTSTGRFDRDNTSYKAFSASEVESVIVPGFGHALNLHIGADGKVYRVINEWLARKGF